MNNVVQVSEPQGEEESSMMYATVDITYDNRIVLQTNKERMHLQREEYEPVEIIENYLPALTNELAKRLTSALQVEISVYVIEISEGSVKVRLGISIRNSALAIILGITANFVTDEIKEFLANPTPEVEVEIAKYEKKCKITEKITEETLNEFDHIHFKSSEYKIRTKTIESICTSSENS